MRSFDVEPEDPIIEENSETGFFGAAIDSEAPVVVCDCIHFLRYHGLYEVGMFRIPGSKEVVNTLKAEYNKHFRTTARKLNSSYSVLNSHRPAPAIHDVASLFKAYFKELKEPMVPEKVTVMMMEASSTYDENNPELVRKLSIAMGKIPQPNRELMGLVISFLREVCTFKHFNQMGAENLATCFVLSILGHGETVNQLQVVGLGGVVLKQLIMLPVKLYMPELGTVQKNTMYSEKLAEEELQELILSASRNEGKAKRGFLMSRTSRIEEDAPPRKSRMSGVMTLRGKKSIQPKYKKNGTRILAEPIKMKDVAAKGAKKKALAQVDFNLADFQIDDDA